MGAPIKILAVTNTYIITSWKVVDDTNYFGDPTHNFIANPATFPSAVAGQGLMTYDTSVGGDTAGQLWFMGANGVWRRGLQTGRITILETNGTTGEGLLVKTTNGIDNCISVQNLDSTHYSATRFLNQYGFETGAVGYGNTNAPFYRNVDYLENFGGQYGFYFSANGYVLGGVQTNSTDWVWFKRGTSFGVTNVEDGQTISFTSDHNGNTVIGTFVSGGPGRGNMGPISGSYLWLNGEGTTNFSTLSFGASQTFNNTVPFINETNDSSLQIGIFPYGEYIHLITNSPTTIISNLVVNNPTNVPSNTNIVRSYMTITNNGTKYFLPLYQ